MGCYQVNMNINNGKQDRDSQLLKSLSFQMDKTSRSFFGPNAIHGTVIQQRVLYEESSNGSADAMKMYAWYLRMKRGITNRSSPCRMDRTLVHWLNVLVIGLLLKFWHYFCHSWLWFSRIVLCISVQPISPGNTMTRRQERAHSHRASGYRNLRNLGLDSYENSGIGGQRNVSGVSINHPDNDNQ